MIRKKKVYKGAHELEFKMIAIKSSGLRAVYLLYLFIVFLLIIRDTRGTSNSMCMKELEEGNVEKITSGGVYKKKGIGPRGIKWDSKSIDSDTSNLENSTKKRAIRKSIFFPTIIALLVVIFIMAVYIMYINIDISYLRNQAEVIDDTVNNTISGMNKNDTIIPIDNNIASNTTIVSATIPSTTTEMVSANNSITDSTIKSVQKSIVPAIIPPGEPTNATETIIAGPISPEVKSVSATVPPGIPFVPTSTTAPNALNITSSTAPTVPNASEVPAIAPTVPIVPAAPAGEKNTTL